MKSILSALYEGKIFPEEQDIKRCSDSDVPLHVYHDCVQCHEDGYLYPFLLSYFYENSGTVGAGAADCTVFGGFDKYLCGIVSAVPLQYGGGDNILSGAVFCPPRLYYREGKHIQCGGVSHAVVGGRKRGVLL